jgi:hypothetical protein
MSNVFTVQNNIVLLGGDSIEVDTPDWFEWLESSDVVSFDYSLGYGTRFLARKRINKDGSALWSAHKKRNGKMRVLGLGKSIELTREKMEPIAEAMSNPSKVDWETFKTRRSPNESQGEGIYKLGKEGLRISLDQGSKAEPSQTRDKTEEFRARIAELEEENRRLQAVANLEKQQKEMCQDKLDKAQQSNKDLMKELLARPQPKDLIRKKVEELGWQEKLMQHQDDPKSNVRYWALARLLEALE